MYNIFPEWQAYLVFNVAVAANSPQIFEGPPQEDDEETPEERHHGGGEECPPHALSIVVARHIGRERDDEVFHLGYEDRGVRVDVAVDSACPHRAVAAMGGRAIRLG